MSSEPKIYQQKAMWGAVTHSLVTNHVGFAGGEKGEFGFFWDMSRYSYRPGTAHSERVCSRARAERPCACCVWAAALISVYFSVLNSISFALQSVFFSRLSVLMHSAAGYGSWFSPTMRNARCTWVGSRSDRLHATNEPHQSFFVSGSRPPLRGGLTPVVLIPVRVRLLYSHQTNEGTAPESVLTWPNSSRVKMPLVSNVRKRKLKRVGFRLANIAHVFRNAGMKEAHWTTTQTEREEQQRKRWWKVY